MHIYRRGRLVEEFSRHDVDKDGRISVQDLRTMMADQGCSETMVQQLTSEHNSPDGKVNFEEFKRFLNFSWNRWNISSYYYLIMPMTIEHSVR